MTTVSLSVDERGVARLSLKRSEKRNALSGEMISALADAAAEIVDHDDIRVVVLCSEGSVFCAGGDLQWMRDQMAADGATRRREAMALAMMLKSLNELPTPLIGRVQGNALGGGVGSYRSVVRTIDHATHIPSHGQSSIRGFNHDRAKPFKTLGNGCIDIRATKALGRRGKNRDFIHLRGDCGIKALQIGRQGGVGHSINA